MNTFHAFMRNNMAVLDLTTGRCTFHPLPEAVLAQTLGGLATNMLLAREFPGALILSAGPLTGSFVPSSGHAVLTLSGVVGPSGHLSLTGGHGVALRALGLDTLVITGRAALPCSVRIRHDVCALPTVAPTSSTRPSHTQSNPIVHTIPVDNATASLPQQRAWLKALRCGAPASVLLAGPAAFTGSPDAILSTEHGSVADQGCVATYMAECNLVSISLESEGRVFHVPLSLDNPARNIITPSRDPLALSETLALQCAEPMASLPVQVGRPMACHHCLTPCRFWLSTGVQQTGHTQANKANQASESKEPNEQKVQAQHNTTQSLWFACTNHRALCATVLACTATARGTSDNTGEGDQSVHCLHACDTWGLDPERVAQVLADSSPLHMEELAHEHMCASAGAARSSATLEASANLSEQTILGGLFGVCPLFLQRHPQVTASTLLTCLAVADGEARLAASLALEHLSIEKR